MCLCCVKYQLTHLIGISIEICCYSSKLFLLLMKCDARENTEKGDSGELRVLTEKQPLVSSK